MPLHRHKAILERERLRREAVEKEAERLRAEVEARRADDQAREIASACADVGLNFARAQYVQHLPDEFLVFVDGHVDRAKLAKGKAFMRKNFPELLAGGTRLGAPLEAEPPSTDAAHYARGVFNKWP